MHCAVDDANILVQTIRTDKQQTDRHACSCLRLRCSSTGAPFGGVIFAVEVVSTYFYVPNLPRMFMASICGTFIVKMIKLAYTSNTNSYVAVFKTNFEETVLTGNAMFYFIVVGWSWSVQRCVCTSGEERCKVRSKYFPANSRKHNYVVGATIIVGCVAMLDSLVVLSYYKTIPDTRSQTAMVDMLFFKTNGKLQSLTWFLIYFSSS